MANQKPSDPAMEKKYEKYLAALHSMQAGVDLMMQYAPEDTTSKHLRVGVNSAMVNQDALVTLLVSKGLFTEEEYVDALLVAARKEAEAYRQRVAKAYGVDPDAITLV